MKSVVWSVVAGGIFGLSGASLAETVIVECWALTFQPEHITVQVGDEIQWKKMNGDHTVTSGTDCIFDGIWWNETINNSNPTFTWTVPAEAVGEIEYFCVPHCWAEMFGTITIEPGPECEWDLNGDGTVGVPDLLVVLDDWGDPYDVTDVLGVIGAWGPCP